MSRTAVPVSDIPAATRARLVAEGRLPPEAAPRSEPAREPRATPAKVTPIRPGVVPQAAAPARPRPLRAARRVARRTTPLGGGHWTWLGIGVGILGLIGLYLLLVHTGLANSVATGVLRLTSWTVSPAPLPF